jgi:hypothetical protein
MLKWIDGKRDFYAGGLMMLIGLGAVAMARGYRMGTLTDMGPGFFPTVLGAMLVLVGIGIALTGRRGEDLDVMHAAVPRWDWRGGSCIIAGTVCFIVFGQYTGLIPAIVSCVFVAALGDRKATIASAAILAVCVAAIGVFLFHYQLKISFPLLQWGGA